MNAIISQGFTAHVSPLLPGLFAPANPISTGRTLGFATIELSGRRSAQGPVLRRHRDGRVTIDAGSGEITGHPVGGTAPLGWWTSLTTSL